MASQLDLLSLPSFSTAGYLRLQLGAENWATSVALLQAVDNSPHKVVVDSPLGAPGHRKTVPY